MALPQDDLNQHDIQALLSTESPLTGLVQMTRVDVDLMSDESIKQMLMDLREYDIFAQVKSYDNEQIARLGREDAVRLLLDARDVLRTYKQERVSAFLQGVKDSKLKLESLDNSELAGVIQTGTYPTAG